MATNIEKLESARDKVVQVYEDEAKDEIPDNGNLTTLNNVILGINNSLKYLKTIEP